MNGITAHAAANLVAKYAGLAYPSDKDKVFELLTFVNNQIWRSGKFHNSTKFASVEVMPNGTMITPHGYNVLLGVRINNKKVSIRGDHFIFHENGPGDPFTYVKRNMLTDFYDLGESPVLIQPTEDENCCKKLCDNCPKVIAVKVPNCVYSSQQHGVLISGLGKDGKEIYTYEESVEGKSEMCLCSDTETDPNNGVDYVRGVKYPLSSNPVMWNNVLFTKITSILKEPTIVPVEIFVVDKAGLATKIARLEPYQTMSIYKIYKLPQSCKNASVILGLFKVSEPNPIVHETQAMLTRNLEALVSLTIAYDYKYNKNDMQNSVAYIADGIGQLNSELRENTSNEENPIQIGTAHDGFQNFPRF